MAKKIIDFYDLCHMYSPIRGLDHFTGNLNKLYGYGDSEFDTTVYNDERLNLEGVMTHFYVEHELLDPALAMFSALRTRIITLNELLAYTISESLKGPVCEKHMRLAESMQKGDVVWNFNYDLLMDNALYAKEKFTDSGYFMRFDYTLVNDKWERFKDVPSDVTMLKLHGSLNWLRCTICGCNLLLRYKKSVLELWEDIRNLLRAGIYCPKCARAAIKDMGLERVIIPPSLVKSFGVIEVRYLWKYAFAFNNIDRLVAIGFRFAEQDPEVEMLLRTMVEHGHIPSDVPILIVNPEPRKVIERFKSIFNRSEMTSESPNSFFNNLP